MLNGAELITILDNLDMHHIPITVHTGGNNWEQIVDVVFCQECDQYHIISERVPLEGSAISKSFSK